MRYLNLVPPSRAMRQSCFGIAPPPPKILERTCGQALVYASGSYISNIISHRAATMNVSKSMRKALVSPLVWPWFGLVSLGFCLSWAWFGLGFAVVSFGFALVSPGLRLGFTSASLGFALVSPWFRLGFALVSFGFALVSPWLQLAFALVSPWLRLAFALAFWFCQHLHNLVVFKNTKYHR